MSSFIGGCAAQEAMKGITGVYTPTNQFCYFDALECVPGEWSAEFDVSKLKPEHYQPVAFLFRNFCVLDYSNL